MVGAGTARRAGTTQRLQPHPVRRARRSPFAATPWQAGKAAPTFRSRMRAACWMSCSVVAAARPSWRCRSGCPLPWPCPGCRCPLSYTSSALIRNSSAMKLQAAATPADRHATGGGGVRHDGRRALRPSRRMYMGKEARAGKGLVPQPLPAALLLQRQCPSTPANGRRRRRRGVSAPWGLAEQPLPLAHRTQSRRGCGGCAAGPWS